MNDITSPDAADNVAILQDQLDYVSLDGFTLDDDLDRGPPTFSILPHRWVQLGKNLLDAGMPTTPTGSWEATRAVVREYMAHLTEEGPSLARTCVTHKRIPTLIKHVISL